MNYVVNFLIIWAGLALAGGLVLGMLFRRAKGARLSSYATDEAAQQAVEGRQREVA